jgi:hypothetical protein
MGDDESFITINGLGVMPHKNYNGEEGYKFTIEQVYDHLFKIKGKKKKDEDGTTPDFSDIFDEADLEEEDLSEEENAEDEEDVEEGDLESEDGEEGEDGEGTRGDEDSSSDGGGEQGANEKNGKLGKGQPVNASGGSIDGGSDSGNGGQSCSKGNGVSGKGKTIGKGYAKALEPLQASQIKQSNAQPVLKFDDHSFWKGGDEHKISKTIWENRVLQTYEIVKNLKRISIGKSGTTWGNAPAFAERIFKEIAERKLDWKTLLNDFIQEDVCDYSFSPPDRRFGDSDFFLPDFNEKEDSVENLLFMIDTSGSMSDDAISEVYSEIKGAIEQFNGKIKGWLGFFDAIVTEPQPFEDENEFKAIRIQGGGGTAFLPIFHYVRDHMKDKNITSIIILTDGYAPYPEEYERMDIPVLWIINNEDATPPWGMIARIPRKNETSF